MTNKKYKSISISNLIINPDNNSIWGVDTMNAYVHSNKLSPVPIDIQTTWDNIQDFMVTLWSQIESE